MTCARPLCNIRPGQQSAPLREWKLTDHIADPYNQAKLRADFVLGMAQRRLFTENGRVLDEVAAERVRQQTWR